jgi:adenylate cyclase
VTLARGQRAGVVPQAADGEWTPAAISQARLVARPRDRGHSLEAIRAATESGRLASGLLEDTLLRREATVTVERATSETGVAPALIERLLLAAGFSASTVERLTEDDLILLHRLPAALDAGLPLVVLPQLVRVYGQALARIADAEVRLLHLHVHEPLLREGVPGLEVSGEMDEIVRRVLHLGSRVMDQLHRRFLAHFLEQDVIGHMEADPGDGTEPAGRLQVAIAFADLAVLVTRSVVAAAGAHLKFERIGAVRMKGFGDATELFVARAEDEDG